jgi:predicted RNase H-like HicB family nuclease
VKTDRYSIIIQWSDEDQAYVVTLPEWGGCHTHGATYAEAAKNAQEVLEMLIEGEEQAGRMLPPAHGFMYPGPSGFTYELNQLAAPGTAGNGKSHQISELLNELAVTRDLAAKKKIRSKLRLLGHRGGLRSQPPRVPSKSFRATSV